MADLALSNEQLRRLRGMFGAYGAESHYRQNALRMRSHVHATLRGLLAADKIAQLTLDEFDRNVWQLGSMQAQGKSFDWHHADRFLAETHPDQLAAMIDSAQIRFVGNVTWGSAVSTLRAYARGRSSAQIEADMRHAVTMLLHLPDPVERRLRQVQNLRTGFGRNVCSGLLMVWDPTHYILYNSVSEQFWAEFDLDFSAGSDWAKSYLRYNAFCQALLPDPELGLQNLIDLDIFLYWHTSVRSAPTPRQAKKGALERKPKPVAAQAGISLAQLEVTRREMSPDRFRAVWGPLYDQLLARERARTTTELTQAEVGKRAEERVEQIQAFLRGQSGPRPTSDVICGWIGWCYELGLNREASSLLQYVLESEVDPALYRRTRRLADASKARLG